MPRKRGATIAVEELDPRTTKMSRIDRDSCSYNSMVRAAAAGRFDAVEQLGIFAKSPSLAIRAHQEGMLRLVFAESTTTKATPKMGFLLRATEIARTPSVLAKILESQAASVLLHQRPHL